MKFFTKDPEKTVLFVCVENAGRVSLINLLQEDTEL